MNAHPGLNVIHRASVYERQHCWRVSLAFMHTAQHYCLFKITVGLHATGNLYTKTRQTAEKAQPFPALG